MCMNATTSCSTGRLARYLRKGRSAERVCWSWCPCVHLASVLEHLAAEVLELAGNAARENKKNRIVPRHMQMAIMNDEGLSKLLGSMTIASVGVLRMRSIYSSLLPEKSNAKVLAKHEQLQQRPCKRPQLVFSTPPRHLES